MGVPTPCSSCPPRQAGGRSRGQSRATGSRPGLLGSERLGPADPREVLRPWPVPTTDRQVESRRMCGWGSWVGLGGASGPCCSQQLVPGPHGPTHWCGVRSGALGWPHTPDSGPGQPPPLCCLCPHLVCVGRYSNRDKQLKGGTPTGGGSAQAHLPSREPYAGVRGEVRGPGSCPFPWGQHDHSALGTKGPSSPQRPGLCGGGRLSDRLGGGRAGGAGRAVALGSRNPVHLPVGRRGGPALGSDAWNSRLGQGHDIRMEQGWAPGRGGLGARACWSRSL